MKKIPKNHNYPGKCDCGRTYTGRDGYFYRCLCGAQLSWSDGVCQVSRPLGVQAQTQEPTKADLARMANMMYGQLTSFGLSGGSISNITRYTPTLDTAKLEALSAIEPRKVYRVPDYVAPIVGWRAWRIANGKLAGLGVLSAWLPEKLVAASCQAMLGYDSHENCPHPKCHCGYWAFADRDKLVAAVQGRYEVKVLGECYLWGRVIMSPNRKNPIGYRAQYAYPKELWLLDESLEYLGSTYNVPVRSLVRCP